MLIALALAPPAGRAAWRSWEVARAEGSDAAHDALRIYLAGAAVGIGLDPTRPASLAAADRDRAARCPSLGLDGDPLAPGKHNLYATMYPASLATMVAPISRDCQGPFLVWWRAIMWLFLGVGAAAAGAGGAWGRWAPVGAVAGLWIAFNTPPALLQVLFRVGQANVGVAGILGLIIGALAVNARGLAAVLSVLGGGVKLVPLLGLWPLLSGRSWRALGLAAGVALALLGWTATVTPPPRFFADLVAILRQQSVAISELRNPGAPLALFLDALRGVPLGTLSLGGVAILLWSPSHRRPELLATAMALLTAWLGTMAAANMPIYAVLYLPALIFLALWPLRAGAPRWAWLVSPVALVLPLLYDDRALAGPQATRLCGIGLGIWTGLAVRLMWTGREALNRRAIAALDTLLLAALLAGWLGRPAPFSPPIGGAPMPLPPTQVP